MADIDYFFEVHEKKFYVALALIMALVLGVWYIRAERARNITFSEIFMQEGKYGEALETLGQEKSVPAYLISSFLYAKIAYYKGDKKDMILDILFKNQAQPDLGRYAALGQELCFARAQGLLEKARNLEPQNTDIDLLTSIISLSRDEYQAAKDYAHRALTTTADTHKKSDCYVVIAAIYTRKFISTPHDMSLYDEAFSRVSKAVEYDDKNDMAYQVGASIMLLKARWDEAIGYYEEAKRVFLTNINEQTRSRLGRGKKKMEFDIVGHISLEENARLMEYVQAKKRVAPEY